MFKKKILALMLSATMLTGSVVPVMAAGNTATGTGNAPIYSFNVMEFVVPTTVTVALNPDELAVKVNNADKTDQVLSLAYGVVNKGNKDVTCKIDFTLTDGNASEGKDKITFASKADEVTNAEKDSYVIFLQATPTTVSDTIDKSTDATALAKLTVGTTDATNAVAIPKTGSLGLSLQKATYSAKAGSETTLGTTNTNDVSGGYELTAIGTDGYKAFTFTGTMNKNTDWSKLTSGITIGLTYTFTETEHANPASPVYGVVALNQAPTFTASTTALTIDYTKGVGDSGLKTLDDIKMSFPDGRAFSVKDAVEGAWAAATINASTIVLDSAVATQFGTETQKATITYTTNDGTAKSVEVTVKLKDAA